MEFDLQPGIPLSTGTFSALVAPVETLLAGLNANPAIRKFLFLYVCGNYSRVLSGTGPGEDNFDVQRAFTVFQLLAILRAAHHTIILVEHDPTLYDDAGATLTRQAGLALRSAAETAIVVLYTPRPDVSFDRLSRSADRIISLGQGIPCRNATPRRPALRVRRPASLPRGQTTLEGF